jgi:hypothetical protein
MALTVSGRQKVKTLKEAFKKEFGVNIRVYHGMKFADDDATLASIRSDDAPGKGDFEVHGKTKVGNVEKQFLDGLGIRVKLENSEGELADKEISLTATASNYRPAKKEEGKGAEKSKETSQVKTTSDGGARLRFWQAVTAGLAKKAGIQSPPPGDRSNLDVSLGRTGFFLSNVLPQDGTMAVRLLLNGQGKDELFQILLSDRKKIETALGATLTWSAPDDARKIISVTGPSLNLDKEADLAHASAWMVDWIAKFNTVFEPRVRNFQPR